MNNSNCNIKNIYKLDGRVPIGKAIPFGLQHILAMFVSNLTPITLIAGAAQPALSRNTAPERHVCGRNRHADSTVPDMENRFQTAGRHGRQLYLRHSAEHDCGELRLPGRCGRSHGRRSL